MNEQFIASAIAKALRLARALAILNIPLGSSYIAVSSEPGEGARSLMDWPERTSVLVETPAGPVMNATARQYILSGLDSKLLRKAHHDCVEILGHPHLPITPQIRELRLEHLLGANLTTDALEEAAILCCLYREQDRPFAVIKVAERLGPLRVDLHSSARLVVAWAYLQLGKITHANYWLQRSKPASALEIAWKHGLQAELYKSQGIKHSKEMALDEIGAAIRVCKDATRDPQIPSYLVQKRLRAYRQDYARILQYLFYDKEKAAAEYERLVDEWSDQPEAVIDLAVVKRNYAECLRTLATGPDDPRCQKARDLLQEAEQVAKTYPQTPLLSEILYEKVKTAEAESNLSKARQHLLECQKAALQSRHFMMLAIAENRHFWRCEPFSLPRWDKIEAELKCFPHHGWAVRTLIDGRLHAAHQLETLQDLLGSFNKLKANKDDLARNPSFDKGGDRFRIAATMAGLQLIGQRMGREVSYWPNFILDYAWAREWLQVQAASTPEAIWSEVR